MRLRRTHGGVEAALGNAWVALVPLLADTDLAGCGRDLLEALANQERIADLIARADPTQLTDLCAERHEPRLPFQPTLLRNFASWQQHWEQAARGLLRRYLPPAYRVARAYEVLARRTFPPLRPGSLFAADPAFYLGNHLTVLPDGVTIPWPTYASDLDFELELACVLRRPIHNATPEQALNAIGGFVVVNDITSRDEQWRQVRHGIFGPVGKAKSFASSMSAEVVTADEVLPHVHNLAGRVRVDGQLWTTTSTAGMSHSVGESVAYASRGEPVLPGEVITFGTLPSGSGVELDRWIRPGQTVRLELDRVATLTNPVGSTATPLPEGAT